MIIEEKIGVTRSFNIWDGYGLKLLKDFGFKFGFITGGKSFSVKARAKDLKADYLFLGNLDKREAYKEIKEKEGVKDEEILYMGDELFDIPLLDRCGFSATVPEASISVIDRCDYVTKRSAGCGAVREVLDLFFEVNNLKPNIPSF